MAKKDTKFQPGQSGNPNGRPKKGKTWGDTYKRHLDEAKVKTESGELVTDRDIVVQKVIAEAKLGNIPAVREMADREEGRAVQRIQEYNEISEMWAIALHDIFGGISGKAKTKQKAN